MIRWYLVVLLIASLMDLSSARRDRSGPYNCTAPPETGLCRALFRRWYYDSEDLTCKEFVWGGCGGNTNRFYSQSQCERSCARQPGSSCSPITCRKYCEYGFMRDDNNCPLCACAPSPRAVDCPQIECYESCPNGFALDSNGCTTCDCRPEVHVRPPRSVTCPPAAVCSMACPHGLKQDDNGCSLCECAAEPEACSPGQCRMACPAGFKKDSRGCDLCECARSSGETKPRGEGGRHHQGESRDHSQGGRHHHKDKDSGRHQQHEVSRHHHGGKGGRHHGKDNNDRQHGRRGNQASPAQLPADESVQCRPMKCPRRCSSGYVKDSFGCNTCRCSSGRRYTDWPRRTTSVPQSGQVTPATEDDCDNRPMCLMYCENGFQKGSDGCPICKCNN